MILGVPCADEATNSWFVVVTILLGIGALTFHGYLQLAPIWLSFVRFVLGAFVLSDWGSHL
jgi:hypothetical protein